METASSTGILPVGMVAAFNLCPERVGRPTGYRLLPAAWRLADVLAPLQYMLMLLFGRGDELL